MSRYSISFNVETIDSAIGVSTNCLVGGFTSEEAIEICYLAGLLGKKLCAFELSEYNPFVEDWRTGRLVSTMFYYFVMGMSARL
jgi:formiminoglutamase